MPPTHGASEHAHQAEFFRRVRASGHPAEKSTYANTNGYLRTPAMRLRAWKEGAKKGVWDVHCSVPCGPFHGMYIEFKVAPNELTPEQVAFGERHHALGYHMVVAYSWREAWDAWVGYLTGKEPPASR